jgi:hypothetical protein
MGLGFCGTMIGMDLGQKHSWGRTVSAEKGEVLEDVDPQGGVPLLPPGAPETDPGRHGSLGELAVPPTNAWRIWWRRPSWPILDSCAPGQR